MNALRNFSHRAGFPPPCLALARSAKENGHVSSQSTLHCSRGLCDHKIGVSLALWTTAIGEWTNEWPWAGC
ncbi:hypothetical protein SRHO_G00337880 [Serrasalmus rhombeus]